MCLQREKGTIILQQYFETKIYSNLVKMQNLKKCSINCCTKFRHLQARSQSCEYRLLVSSRPSVHPYFEWNSAPAGRIFMNFIFGTVTTICQENSCLVKIGQKQQTLQTKIYVNLRYLSYLWVQKSFR